MSGGVAEVRATRSRTGSGGRSGGAGGGRESEQKSPVGDRRAEGRPGEGGETAVDGTGGPWWTGDAVTLRYCSDISICISDRATERCLCHATMHGAAVQLRRAVFGGAAKGVICKKKVNACSF